MLYKVCDAFTRLHKLGMSQVQPADGLKEAVVGHARPPSQAPPRRLNLWKEHAVIGPL